MAEGKEQIHSKIEELSKVLNDQSADIPSQVKAVMKLRRIAEPEALWLICRYCGHRQRQIAEHCQLTIKKCSEDEIAKMLQQLIDTDNRTGLSVEVFKILLGLKTMAVLNYLAKNVEELTTDRNKNSMIKMWVTKTPFHQSTIPFLIKLSIVQLKSDGKKEKAISTLELTRTLTKIEPELPVCIAQYASEQKNLAPIARAVALGLIASIEPSKQIVRFILPILQDENPHVRSKAVKVAGHALVGMKIFKQLLEDVDARVRANALEAIWTVPQISNAQRTLMVKMLKPLLDDEATRVRANAARALHKLGDSTGETVLKAMVQSGTPEMKKVAQYTLDQIEGEKNG